MVVVHRRVVERPDSPALPVVASREAVIVVTLWLPVRASFQMPMSFSEPFHEEPICKLAVGVGSGMAPLLNPPRSGPVAMYLPLT